MKSKITGGATEYLFTANVLNTYPVKYYRCVDTGFIQTEEPFWLEEAYSSAITSLDLGLLYRNIKLSDAVERVIAESVDTNGSFLDYAGGYGVFTRLMRDRGYNFFHTDKYCDNLFARHFDLTNPNAPASFNMVTAFEVFEHLNHPVEEIAEIRKHSDTILFSTELAPDKPITSPQDWWYIVPETGQHIAFYTIKALETIGEKLGLTLYSNNVNLHILTARKFSPGIFSALANPFVEAPSGREREKDNSFFAKLKALFTKEPAPAPINKRKSLLEADFNYVKSLLMSPQAGQGNGEQL